MLPLFPIGAERFRCAHICQQAGCEGVNECSRDISTPQPHLYQGSRLACPGMLCSHWRGVREAGGVVLSLARGKGSRGGCALTGEG